MIQYFKVFSQFGHRLFVIDEKNVDSVSTASARTQSQRKSEGDERNVTENQKLLDFGIRTKELNSVSTSAGRQGYEQTRLQTADKHAG